VLDREDAVVAALIEGVEVAAEVDRAEAGQPVAPPAHLPGVPLAVGDLAEEAEAVALRGEDLGVLGVGVDDAVDVRAQRHDRVDAEPEQVRGIEVEVEAEREHPLPQLRRVGEVAGSAVGVPALHHAVLDHQLHPALARVVDQRRHQPLGCTQVFADRGTRVATDEGADRDAAERGGGVDAGPQVGVDRGALVEVGVQVVVVVGEGRELQPVLLEGGVDAVGLGGVEAVGGDVGGGEGTVAERRPGGQLQRLVAVPAGPGRDLLERALGHAGAEHPQLHGATSTQARCRADSSTASVTRTARSPSASRGRPSGSAPAIAA
jgi:hypothetical protein